MLCASLEGRGAWGRMDTYMCMTECLHCSPETITTLLISYTPIQNVSSVKKIRNYKKAVLESSRIIMLLNVQKKVSIF